MLVRLKSVNGLLQIMPAVGTLESDFMSIHVSHPGILTLDALSAEILNLGTSHGPSGFMYTKIFDKWHWFFPGSSINTFGSLNGEHSN